VACQLSQPGDVVLIAGKGHENYQEVKGEKLPFDDYKIAQEIFSKTS
jgi:UDP-N-acetylmuramoyl-L-alanyl-D-glutamate--2,6-diaminopimelate ligase